MGIQNVRKSVLFKSHFFQVNDKTIYFGNKELGQEVYVVQNTIPNCCKANSHFFNLAGKSTKIVSFHVLLVLIPVTPITKHKTFLASSQQAIAKKPQSLK